MREADKKGGKGRDMEEEMKKRSEWGSEEVGRRGKRRSDNKGTGREAKREGETEQEKVRDGEGETGRQTGRGKERRGRGRQGRQYWFLCRFHLTP